jgi:UDP-N-acetyl-D-glucosamine dehydrogenase
LKKKSAVVSYHDPHIARLSHDGLEMVSVPDLLGAVKEAECVVIVTNHSVYNYPAILEAASLVVDTRNALGVLGRGNPKVVRL